MCSCMRCDFIKRDMGPPKSVPGTVCDNRAATPPHHITGTVAHYWQWHISTVKESDDYKVMPILKEVQ